MKKFLSVLLLSLFAALPAENLLPNGDFSRLTGAGLPRGWEIRGPLACFQPGKDSLTMGGNAAANLMAIQWDLPLKPGKKYQVSFRAAGKAKFRCYVEWSYLQDGKKLLRSAGSQWRTAVPAGKEERYSFALPANAQRTYIVLNARSAEKVTISHLQITEYSAQKTGASGAGVLLPNADFRELSPKGIPVNWGIRGPAENFRFAPGNVTVKGEMMWLIAGRLPLAGRKGTVTYRVRGQGEYRVYVEWYATRNGQKVSRATPTVFLAAPEADTPCSFRIDVPSDANAAVLAVTVKSKTGIRFSDFRITAEENPKITLVKGQKTRIPLPKLLPHQRYRLSYQAKGEGDSGDTTGYHYFSFQLLNGENNAPAVVRADTWSNSFQNKSLEFVTGSRQPELSGTSDSLGKVVLQNLSLKTVAGQDPAARIVLTSPAFRGTFYSSNPEQKVEGRVIVRGECRGGTAELPPHRCPLQWKDGAWHFSLPGATGKLTVTLTPKSGEVKITVSRRIARLPKAPHEVVVNARRQLLVDGKPFFPVLFWNLDSGDAVHAAARCGINAARFHASRENVLRRHLDEAQRENMKIVVGFPGFPKTETADAFRAWQHTVENTLSPELLAHPALLGYFMVDEPRWTGYPLVMLQKGYEFLSRLDPYHPIWINAAPRGSVPEQRPYGSCCDVYGVDIYPVPQPNSHSHLDDKTMSCVGKYVRWCEEITDGVKPVWMALQGFSWKDLKGDSDPAGYPSRAQTRFMIYDALINGADALTWWGLYSITRPQFYRDLLAETREFHRISGAVSGECKPIQRRGALESREWCGKGWKLVITANTSDRSVAGFAPYEVKFQTTGTLPAPAWQLPVSRPEIKGIDPLIGNMDRKRTSRPFPGTPGLCWIWDGGLRNTPNSVVFFRRAFTLKTKPAKALLRCAADDAVDKILLDGHPLGSCDGYQYLEEIDVTTLLAPGRHELTFQARDKGVLPCGFLAELEITYPDRSVERIVSGKSFQTAPALNGPWHEAVVIQLYGGSPWGRCRILGPQEK